MAPFFSKDYEMKIIQITDIHLTTEGKSILGRDPNLNFQNVLNHINENQYDAEVIIITGDLSDWGETSDYLRLKNIIEKNKIPIHLCIGNHDDRANFLSVFPTLSDKNGFIQNVVKLSKGSAILLDTWGPETHAGHFCMKRKDWLRETLSTVDKDVFLFLHHNIVDTKIKPVDQIKLLDTSLLREVCNEFKDKIRFIFHGHCHLILNGSFSGIPFYSPRGTNHAAWPAFQEKKFLSSADLAETYSVIMVEDEDIMVHTIEFNYRGEIKNEGLPDYNTWDKNSKER